LVEEVRNWAVSSYRSYFIISVPPLLLVTQWLSTIESSLWSAVRRRVGIDPRALVAFRIGLAGVFLFDLSLRIRHLGAFYTDRGVLPRTVLLADYVQPYSVHALTGIVYGQAALFAAAGGCALGLLVGYRTRWAAVGAWLLTYSLHTRNPMILNSGDTLLLLLLLWAMFLPLDRWTRVDDPSSAVVWPTVVTPATAAVLLQVWLVYGINAIHKLRGSAWLAGDAVEVILQLGQFTVLLGPAASEVSGLLSVATYVWLGLLVASPLLLLSAGRLRTLIATLLIGGHLGMILTMQLGVFPLVSIVGLLLFYPSVVWDRIGAWTAPIRRLIPTEIRLARPEWAMGIGRCSSLTQGWLSAGSRLGVTLSRWGGIRWVRVLPVVLLVGVILSAGSAVGGGEPPDPAAAAIETVGIDQSWRMFAPEPLSTEVWYVAPGVLTNGSTVDVYGDDEVDYARPARVDRTYPSARWRKYLENVRTVDNEAHRSYFADYLCGRWNRTHATDVRQVAVYAVTQEVRGDGGSPSKELLTIHDCGGGLLQ